MKHMSVLLIFTFVWVMIASVEAHALFLQGPIQPYSPYPNVLSDLLDTLPQGVITIIAGDETFYYYKGIFYQKLIREQKYVAVPPPIGAVVFDIPRGYQVILVDGVTCYEYGGVYYKRVLEGYKVIYPPV